MKWLKIKFSENEIHSFPVNSKVENVAWVPHESEEDRMTLDLSIKNPDDNGRVIHYDEDCEAAKDQYEELIDWLASPEGNFEDCVFILYGEDLLLKLGE